jgi:hypothetical protein
MVPTSIHLLIQSTILKNDPFVPILRAAEYIHLTCHNLLDKYLKRVLLLILFIYLSKSNS